MKIPLYEPHRTDAGAFLWKCKNLWFRKYSLNSGGCHGRTLTALSMRSTRGELVYFLHTRTHVRNFNHNCIIPKMLTFSAVLTKDINELTRRLHNKSSKAWWWKYWHSALQ